MFTVIETPIFQRQASHVWSQDERHAFIDWIAQNSNVGVVIPGAEGARKVRWALQGKGKRGGARVIYFNLNENEVVLLVAVYAKSDQANLGVKQIKRS